MLADVTLMEIIDLIDAEIAGGNESEKQEGRRRLRDVIAELTTDEPDRPHDLLGGRAWRLALVDVSGVGGVATLDPGPLVLAPARGVTLVRGDNGCGKTSLARSIECTLYGREDLSGEVAGALWAAELVADGEATASVRLGLESEDGGRLTIDATLATGEGPTISAVLTDADGTREVTLGDAWQRVLSPVPARPTATGRCRPA